LKTYSVIVSDNAEADLTAIYAYISERVGGDVALRFVERIDAYFSGFSSVPERGTKRDDLRPGLRTVRFRRRATILFEVDHRARQVIIHGIYYAGRNLEGEADENDSADETD
jgi:toxin ParE1/3/4